MILLLDTSTSVCRLTLIDGDAVYSDEWQADRELAKGLLGYLAAQLEKNDRALKDVTAIGGFLGPGSFTGLRIGLTVLNTLADAQQLPIVGAIGEHWQDDVLARLKKGENEAMLLPFYGSEATITKPRK